MSHDRPPADFHSDELSLPDHAIELIAPDADQLAGLGD
jgi:hypothetical protein